MELTSTDFGILGFCLEGFFFGTISVNSQAQVAKAVEHCPIPGLYSGIFAIYLQHHQSTDKAKNILFYALSVLYALSAATSIIDILQFPFRDAVSLDDYSCLTFFSISCTELEHRDSVPP